MRIEKNITERNIDLELEVVEAFKDYRSEEKLSWIDALNATARLLKISVDQVEDILIDHKVYENKFNKRNKV